MKRKCIQEFKDEYAFLSNMYDCPVKYKGLVFQNSESAFQSAKYKDKNIKCEFVGIDGKKAKSLGSPRGSHRLTKEEAEKWNNKRIKVMKEVVRAKFTQNPELLDLLIQTGNKELIEGRSFRPDTFWGKNLKTGKGENNLGKILMEIREELK